MPATAVTRLHGRYAICIIGALTLNVFDWEMEIRTDYVDGTGHGDIWDVPVPLKYNWTARARGFFDTTLAGGGTYLATFAAQTVGTPPPDQNAVSFVAYASANTALPVFHGQGFITRAHWAAPMSMVEQEIELRGVGLPTSIP